MFKNVIACGMIICAIFFTACGDNEESKLDSAKIAESSTQNVAQSTADSATQNIDSANPAKNIDSATLTQSVADSTKIAESSPNPANLYKKCIACHGARGDKVAPGSAGNITIADLSKETLISDLKGYRAKTLNKGGTAAIMYLQANGLSDADIETLGEYISNFKK